ncbi:MAG: hypothetical protein AB8H86_33370, partial [Polyangiales bacterium]
QEVTSALRRGEVDSALYLLAEYARTWHAVTAVGVTPPPAPAAPLARADARFVVEGPRCRATSVVQDASVFPPRHVAHVSCGDGERHECTLSGVALDTITCAPDQAPLARSLDEALAGDWTLLRRRRREQCTYAARFGEREDELGVAECGSQEGWIRACRGEGFVGAVLLHTFESSPPAHVAILDEGAFRWVEAPVFPSRQHVVSCDANAMRFTHTSRRSEFVTDGMRPGMLRPPTQGFIMLGTHRCTAEGCEASSTELLSTGGRWETAAPVGEELVVVEAHHREDGDGLVARIAPLDELADAPALWVFDPADGIEFEGASVFRMWALGPRAAVLLLTDVTRGVMAVRFEAGGGFSYLAPAR